MNASSSDLLCLFASMYAAAAAAHRGSSRASAGIRERIAVGAGAGGEGVLGVWKGGFGVWNISRLFVGLIFTGVCFGNVLHAWWKP